MGSVVKAKVGEKEGNKIRERNRRMRKEMVVSVQTVVEKNGFLFQLEYGQIFL